VLTVGLTGGYATGKSFVAQTFERLGCHLIYADRLGHDVLLPGGEAYGPTVDAFGADILTAEGTIDRKKLGKLVFGSGELLRRLNAIVHPAVFRLEEQLLARFAAEDPSGIALVEAAILIETGRYKRFSRLIVTVCDLETQIARAMGRDNLTREEVLDRIEKQLAVEEKQRYADYVIDTGGTKDETTARVQMIHGDLCALANTETK
jgi:dephospho-CoA kinase